MWTARAYLPQPLRPLHQEAAAGFVAVGVAALATASMLPFAGPLPLVATAGVLAVAAALALGALEAHHRHGRFGGANHVTLVRLGGTAIFAGLALGAASALLALDGLDGWLARRQGLASDFGARFDMEVDALLILILSAIAWSLGDTGAWVLGLGLVRYAFVLAGWLVPRLAAPLPPSRRRKSVCVLQVVALTVLLAPVIAPPWSSLVAAVAFAALIASFAVDIRWLLARPRA